MNRQALNTTATRSFDKLRFPLQRLSRRTGGLHHQSIIFRIAIAGSWPAGARRAHFAVTICGLIFPLRNICGEPRPCAGIPMGAEAPPFSPKLGYLAMRVSVNSLCQRAKPRSVADRAIDYRNGVEYLFASRFVAVLQLVSFDSDSFQLNRPPSLPRVSRSSQHMTMRCSNPTLWTVHRSSTAKYR